MTEIRTEQIGDTRHDSATEHSNPAVTSYPLTQRTIDEIWDWMAACEAEWALLPWTQGRGHDKTTHSNRSFGRWTGQCLGWQLKSLRKCSIELAIAAWRLRSCRDNCRLRLSVEQQAYLNALGLHHEHDLSL